MKRVSFIAVDIYNLYFFRQIFYFSQTPHSGIVIFFTAGLERLRQFTNMYNRDPYTFANQDSAPQAITDVIIGVFSSWDMPVTDFKYVNCFTLEGVLHLGPEPTKGHKALKQAHAMIHPTRGPVVKSQHYVDRLFILPGGDEKVEAVVTGLHENRLRDGAVVVMDFASWVTMTKVKEDGPELKVEHWRVFQDHADMREAMSKLPPYEEEESDKFGVEKIEVASNASTIYRF